MGNNECFFTTAPEDTLKLEYVESLREKLLEWRTGYENEAFGVYHVHLIAEINRMIKLMKKVQEKTE